MPNDGSSSSSSSALDPKQRPQQKTTVDLLPFRATNEDSSSSALQILARDHSSIDIRREEGHIGVDIGVEGLPIPAIIQEPNRVHPGWVLALIAIIDGGIFTFLATQLEDNNSKPAQYLSKITMALLAMSLILLFLVGISSKKLSTKLASIGNYLAYSCNITAFLLTVGFFFAFD